MVICIWMLTAVLLTATFDPPAIHWSKPNYQGMLLTVASDHAQLVTLENGNQPDDTQTPPLLVRWDLLTGREICRYPLVAQPTVGNARSYQDWMQANYVVSPDGNALLVTWPLRNSETRTNLYGKSHLQIFDLKSGETRGPLIRNVVWIGNSRASFSPDGKWFWFFKTGYGEQIDVHSTETGALVLTAKSEPPDFLPMGMAFTEVGSHGAILFNSAGNQKKLRLFTLPEGQLIGDKPLPKEQQWHAVQSWQESKLLVEYTREDAESSNDDQPSQGTRVIRRYSRHFVSIDPSADDMLSAPHEEEFLRAYYGQSGGKPNQEWDSNPARHVRITQYMTFYDAAKPPTDIDNLGYYRWKDLQIWNKPNGRILLELDGLPYDCLVSQDGHFVAASGKGPNFETGLYIWKVPL